MNRVGKIIIIIFIVCELVMSCTFQKAHKINTFIFDSKEYKSLSNFKKTKYLDSITSCYKLLNNDSLNRNFLFTLSAEYYYLNNYKKSLKINPLGVIKLFDF